MEQITPEQLMNAVVVLLAVFAAIVTIDKVVDIIKKWRAPSTDMATKLANDKIRLDGHDKSIHNLQSSTRALCSGVLALLDHELHNGNTEQMESAHKEIMTYLQGHMSE